MFWREHSYVVFSTTYIGFLTLHRKSDFDVGKKYHAPFSSQVQFEYSWGEPPIGPLKLNLTARVEVVHVVVMFA